jgi:hypothetical protein
MRYKIALVACLIGCFLQRATAQTSVQNIAHLTIPVPFKGFVEDAYEIQDAAGLHIFVASKEQKGKTDSLFVKYFTKVGNAWRLDWQIKDFSIGAAVNVFTVTKFADIDADNVFETLFAYEVGGGDMSAGNIVTRKAMLFYKNKKYAIRGSFRVGNDDKGDVLVDKDFDTIPKPVKKYAIGFWNAMSDFLIIKTIPVPAD